MNDVNSHVKLLDKGCVRFNQQKLLCRVLIDVCNDDY